MARAFTIIWFLLLFLLMYYSTNIFIYFGISEEIAENAGIYIIWAYPSLLLSGI